MCYSPEASFAASALLAPAGIYCVRAALLKAPTYLPLAAVPFFFALQQGCEGIVWLALARDDAALTQKGALGFLFFALAFWPFWLPLCATAMEPRRRIKALLAGLTVLSLFWTVVLYMPVAADPDRWLTTKVVHHSIQYEYLGLPIYTVIPRDVLRLFYFLTVFAPLAVGGTAGFRWFGVLLALSAVVSQFIFSYAFVSVWCLMAAVLSGQLCYLFYTMPPPLHRQEMTAEMIGGSKG